MSGGLLSGFRRDRRGTTAVEFAMIAAPMVLMLLGTIEFGRLMWARQALEETATTGARCMGIPQAGCTSAGAYSAAATKTFIRDSASQMGIVLADTDIVLDRAASCSGLAGFSKVRITYSYDSALPHVIVALALGPQMVSQVCFPNQG